MKVYITYDVKSGVVIQVTDTKPSTQNYIEMEKNAFEKAWINGINCVDLNTKNMVYKDFRHIDLIKSEKLNQLRNDFANLKNQGMLSKVINKKINSNYTDLMNMQSLLTYMNSNSLETIKFRCFDNSFIDITKEQLQSMIDELIAYGLEIYQRKWAVENVIETADRDSLLKLKWNEKLEMVSSGN